MNLCLSSMLLIVEDLIDKSYPIAASSHLSSKVVR